MGRFRGYSDVDELEKTGVHAHTTYTPVSILSEVAKGEGESDKKYIQNNR